MANGQPCQQADLNLFGDSYFLSHRPPPNRTAEFPGRRPSTPCAL